MITIFSTCKPFIGEFKIIQTNAIKSWRECDKNIEVILFGNEEGVEEISNSLNLKHIKDIKRNEGNTPFLNDMFKKAKEVAKYNILCYVNADIILLPSFLNVVSFVSNKFENFLITGRRWHLKIDKLIEYNNPLWDKELYEYVIKNAELTSPLGIDYFIFSRSLYKILPPLLVGRTCGIPGY
ncbi:MAG: hypothetical protein QXU40_03435 [Candidatus Pacearchaeota archaeon]